jgi:hypothetical protein
MLTDFDVDGSGGNGGSGSGPDSRIINVKLASVETQYHTMRLR